jgi:DNA-directed RNA polymerase specialized sigma24 family protein
MRLEGAIASRLEALPGAPTALRVVLSRSGAAAEDLVQATCLRAIERVDQFVPGTQAR